MADNNTYDAIVIGSGISGGWAAKELTEKGLKVLCQRHQRIMGVSSPGRTYPADDQRLSGTQKRLSAE